MVQPEGPVLPSSVEYEPPGHNVQVPVPAEAAYVPTGHTEQAASFAPETPAPGELPTYEYLPAGHRPPHVIEV